MPLVLTRVSHSHKSTYEQDLRVLTLFSLIPSCFFTRFPHSQWFTNEPKCWINSPHHSPSLVTNSYSSSHLQYHPRGEIHKCRKYWKSLKYSWYFINLLHNHYHWFSLFTLFFASTLIPLCPPRTLIVFFCFFDKYKNLCQHHYLYKDLFN